MTATVRTAQASDAEVMGQIHVRAWRAAYRGVMPDEYLDNLSDLQRAQMWAEAIQSDADALPRRHLSVVLWDSAVVGFAAAGVESGADEQHPTGQLYAINLDPAHWGQGLGRTLLRAVTQELRDDGYQDAVLWVVPTNTRAIGLYESERWHADGATQVQDVLGAIVEEARFRRPL